MISAYGRIDQTAFIHPKAEVHRDVTIGARTKIWQFASLLRGAVLGDDCTMASGACFDGSRAGNRVILCHNLAAGPGFLPSARKVRPSGRRKSNRPRPIFEMVAKAWPK
mgnify:CR=1 FL=1